MPDMIDETKTPHFLGFKSELEDENRARDIKRLKDADTTISTILRGLLRVKELVGHQEIAEVENFEEKIENIYKEIYEQINRPEQEEGQELTQEGRPQKGDDLPIKKHPDLPDMGGMPLEIKNIPKEWLDDLGISKNTQDKTEIQNQIKKKLQAKLKNAMKMAAKLQNKLKMTMTNKPKLEYANKIVHKFRMALEELKNKPVLQDKPEYKPAPAPAPDRPRPTPYG